jgi:GNAT superfamily N-acetyltransferase
MSTNMAIRAAKREDVPLLLSLIRELAEYERLVADVSATEETLAATLFGARPVAEALLAECGGEPSGFAIFFHNYSTFLAKPGVYVEDLYVRQDFRGRGVGRALMRHMARLALERGCGRLELSALDWNRPAIGFYRRLGAAAMGGWTIHRFTGRTLDDLAK